MADSPYQNQSTQRTGGGTARNIDVALSGTFDAAVDNAYPLLTREINGAGGVSPVPGASGTYGLAERAAATVSQVLGWKLKAGDHRGFANALSQRFDLTEVEGHIEWKYKPGNYLLMSDLSADKPITGAQASILMLVRDACDKGKTLLDGLKSLRNLADAEDGEAIKSVIRNQMSRLVEELSTPGGPRIPLVDQIYNQLLGTGIGTDADADHVGGSIGRLRREFGLGFTVEPRLVNTIVEEENQTNFRILADYIQSARRSWDLNRAYFNRTAEGQFFGTQTVHLSRQLSVIASEVEQVRVIFDSVFISAAERITTRIVMPADADFDARIAANDPIRPAPGENAELEASLAVYDDAVISAADGEVALTIEELLTWIQQFAVEKGPDFIEDGGKYGVRFHFLPEAVQLRNLTYGATDGYATGTLPPAYRSTRVLAALEGLASHLDELCALSVGLSHVPPTQGRPDVLMPPNGNGNGTA